MSTIRPEDFNYLRDLIKSRSGLALSDDKAYLIESRLMPIARKHMMEGIEFLVKALKAEDTGDLAIEVTEAMTTNESFFFRDVKPFHLFRDVVLPNLLKNRAEQKKIRIWCTACSSGQEPYSLAMLLDEMAVKITGWNIEIMATDISTEALNKAQSGTYSQFEVQRGLPVQYLVKYFEKKEGKWSIQEKLKQQINFKYFNLLDSFTALGKFDVVFCRNILIYFDTETKMQTLDRIANILPNDGYLFLGSTETVIGVTDRFQPDAEHRGLYIPVTETSSRSETV